MSPLLIPAAIEWAVLTAAVVAIVRQLRIDAGMHPRRGEGDTQNSGQVRGERCGFRTIHNEANS